MIVSNRLVRQERFEGGVVGIDRVCEGEEPYELLLNQENFRILFDRAEGVHVVVRVTVDEVVLLIKTCKIVGNELVSVVGDLVLQVYCEPKEGVREKSVYLRRQER